MKKLTHAMSSILLALALAAPSLLARADDFHRFRDHDIGRFGVRDFGVWRGGHWIHGRHGGRLGWWWVAGGLWYFYPSPIYPYPDPYVPPVAVVTPAPTAPVGPAPAQSWYYCDNPQGYYPYVSTCNSGWRPVPATPTPPPVR